MTEDGRRQAEEEKKKMATAVGVLNGEHDSLDAPAPSQAGHVGVHSSKCERQREVGQMTHVSEGGRRATAGSAVHQLNRLCSSLFFSRFHVTTCQTPITKVVHLSQGPTSKDQ